jgi:hypothetical protein
MSRSGKRITVGLAALALGVTGSVLTVSAASAAPVSAVSIYKSTACPPGYTIDPQNSQQCIPMSPDPYGNGGGSSSQGG